jgi:hypothetical protein
VVIPVRSRRAIWLALMLLSVGLRVAVALYHGDGVPVDQDDHSYSQLAWRLATGHGYSFDRPWYPFTPADTPTAHWSFLYTALVAGVYRLVGYQPLVARLAGAVITGLLLPWAVHRLARRAFPERQTVALVAAAGAAGYAYFILYAARIATEGLYMVALLWSLDSALGVAQGLRRDNRVAWMQGLQLGLSLGVTALLRQAILPWAPVLFAWLLLNGHRGKLANTQTLKPIVVAGLALVACIAPWTVRNYRAYGSFLLLNSNTGYAMYSAQHPVHGNDFQPHEAAPLPDDLMQGRWLTEPEWDRSLMGRGIGFVVAEPGRFALLTMGRLSDLFIFWPTHDTPLLHNVGRLVSFAAALPFMILGSVLATRECRQQASSWMDFLCAPPMILLGFCLFYALLHVLTWAMPRYRVPVDAVMMPFAALGVIAVYQVLRRHVAYLASVRNAPHG